jgi:hypothetical protein
VKTRPYTEQIEKRDISLRVCFLIRSLSRSLSHLSLLYLLSLVSLVSHTPLSYHPLLPLLSGHCIVSLYPSLPLSLSFSLVSSLSVVHCWFTCVDSLQLSVLLSNCWHQKSYLRRHLWRRLTNTGIVNKCTQHSPLQHSVVFSCLWFWFAIFALNRLYMLRVSSVFP